MRRRTFLKLAGQASAAMSLVPGIVESVAGAGNPSGVPSIAGDDWDLVSGLLDRASSRYSETWDDATCRTLMKGAYLGNGDFGVHLGGTIHALRFHLGKNGFHAGNDVAAGRYNQHILNLATVGIEAASGAESGTHYHVTQDIRNAEIRTECLMAGAMVRTRSYLSPTSNLWVLELSTDSGREVPLRMTLSVIGNRYVAKSAGTSGSVVWVTKEPNADGAPFYVKGAVAAKVLGSAVSTASNGADQCTLLFTLPSSGAGVRLVVQAEHTKNSGSPLASLLESVRTMADEELIRIGARNRSWWKAFWLQSHIRLGDDLQNLWYNHLYLVGSCARSGGARSGPGHAPGHWGPWNRADDMMWFSNLGMNYNAQNPYYGTFAANHVDLVDPYIATVKHYTETTGRKRVQNRWVSPQIAARMPANCRGVQNEGSFTAHGTSCGGGAYPEEDCCMATNAVFGVLPIVWKWKYGQDREFLEKVCYPLLLAVADFYDDYIGKPVDGRYEVYGSVHEGADWFARNDMFSLGAVRFLYREIIAASIELKRDAGRRAHWQDILDRMSEYPLQAWENTVTFRPDAVHDVMQALHYQGGARNTGLMFTTTFDNISHGTLPAYRIATCSTLDKGDMFHPQRWCGWQNGNDFGMMFVMAVRAGYRAERVIQAIKAWKPEANGIVSQKEGGGIETAGIIEAINNMLLQSHDGVIRLFPNWDRRLDAEFKRLRAVGAFLVEARYRASGQGVDSVRIFSEKGGRCVLQCPFEGGSLGVIRADNRQTVATVQEEELFSFRTQAGVTYEIVPAKPAPVRVGVPGIQIHPASQTVVFPEPATFTVAATGSGVRYQWQKNRVNIPGATAASYTTPATSLHDLGSAYRCVVSNRRGITRSQPGILNPNNGSPREGRI